MTLFQSDAERVVASAGRMLDLVDSVYFLPFPDWEKELRSNRWHFAARWAKVKQVVMLNAVLAGGEATSSPAPGIPNCRVLRIASDRRPNLLASRQIQLGQVLAYMTEHHHQRPLLWSYNPDLVHLAAAVPAAVRVHHATEAYFEMPSTDPSFLRRLSAMVTISDVTIAVSEGVAAGLRAHIPSGEVVTITNGCDYRHYSAGSPDPELEAKARAYRRVAIYAGNINDRLDFGLMNRLARAHPDVLFAMFGPRAGLDRSRELEWRELAGLRNVFAPGAVDPDRLRDLYAASDVGLIPYRQDPWLVENGLPLKALEMCATGLPVVSSLMRPLVGMAAALVVASSEEEFVYAFERASRRTLSPAEAAELSAVSAANDYDTKFNQALDEIDRRITAARAVTRMDLLIEVLGQEWFADEQRFGRWLNLSPAARGLAGAISAVAAVLPAPVKRRLIPDRLRAATRELRGR